ncbi:hypothetical protein DXZ20_04480 [Leptolyngbyaceae cyanobacterium CCMR0081]|uniref:Uncharacterized protein n=1 Tax=Adonisia turfae CCMR0081 TaxID=2292702 RepID=A0A6M0RFM5_9CYAN|nr:hypothetical protein [Adonisia turfae CCMR0081]
MAMKTFLMLMRITQTSRQFWVIASITDRTLNVLCMVVACTSRLAQSIQLRKKPRGRKSETLFVKNLNVLA